MQSIFEAEPTKIIVGMVGLPARGKSYISKKIYRYLNWLGFKTQVYNVGNYRRKYMSDNNISLTPDFFDPHNQQNRQLRQKIAGFALEDLIQYINHEGTVAIFDATNVKKARRQLIAKKLQSSITENYSLIWIESICDDQAIIKQNIKKVKVHGLDFKNKSEEEATEQFQRRILHYKDVYEPLEKQQGFAYLKTINVGEGIEIHKIKGYLAEKIMTYTINLTISPKRIIYLTRHGKSLYNIEDRIGGNPHLSQEGMKYAMTLPKIMQDLIPEKEDRNATRIITSTLVRTKETVQFIKINDYPIIQLKLLDQLNAGICENMTYAEIKEKYPEISKARDRDKLYFRYPSGESYHDVIGRLEPLIYWVERQKSPVMIIGHQAILRCISAYFYNVDLKNIPYIDVPLHTIIRMTPETYTFKQEYFVIDTKQMKLKLVQRQQKKKYSIDNDGSKRPSSKMKFKQSL